VVESLLCGTPVVTFPVYPFPHMLTKDLGAIARDMTAESLADAIETAVASTSRHEVHGAAEGLFGLPAAANRLTEVWMSKSRPP
jgi:hypothetical protein